jgi:hypothetical protein
MLLLGDCGEEFKRVRIGSKDFTEQNILAEMMALLAENAGVRVERTRATWRAPCTASTRSHGATGSTSAKWSCFRWGTAPDLQRPGRP